jgi:hypothetical protein
MSPTNSTDEPNWILFQTRYDYMALPVDLATEVLRHMKMMSKDNGQWEIAQNEISIQLLPSEKMTVALVKAKMLGKEKSE